MTTAAGLDMSSLSKWVDNTEVATDTITPRLALSYHATLDLAGDPPLAGDALPSGFHWLLCPPIAPWSGLGEDGHPARGGFLPPVPLPRRMWAGSRIEMHDDFRVGDEVTRTSTVTSMEHKQGRSGELVFVGIEHTFKAADRLCLTEHQDVVYREMPPPGSGAAQAATPAVQGEAVRRITPDAPMLFRYSAITFNGHRIHYDADYCREVEGYPGCIIHGPVTGTTLMLAADDLAAPARVRRFDFKARAPAFLGDTLIVYAHSSGGRIELNAHNQHGVLIMSAVAEAA